MKWLKDRLLRNEIYRLNLQTNFEIYIKNEAT